MPGCVDGWLTLLDRYGRLSVDQVLEPAANLAQEGFTPSPLLIEDAPLIASVPGANDFQDMGDVVRREGIARSLRAVSGEGRDGWYGGEFGDGLIRVGAGLFTSDDLAQNNAEWVEPVSAQAWGHTIWSAPPNSQGYLTVASAWIASGLDLPLSPQDPLWLHFLVEAARLSGFDRDAVLHDEADGHYLVSPERLGTRRDQIRSDQRADLGDAYSDGGTIYLAAIDSDGMGVSLIQSNANGFGTRITLPEIGVFLQNRGIGFSLQAGHPAEYLPGRRPRHTLSPALVTAKDGTLRTILGTMGGDSQPQILLQLLARVLSAGQSVAQAMAAPRWVLAPTDSMGFDTWEDPSALAVALEENAPSEWNEVADKGHVVRRHHDEHYGHAQMIDIIDGLAHGAADPRSVIGSVAQPS
jgi:gamma-glutamyltranspeptidase/glutathione hydrolase